MNGISISGVAQGSIGPFDYICTPDGISYNNRGVKVDENSNAIDTIQNAIDSLPGVNEREGVVKLSTKDINGDIMAYTQNKDLIVYKKTVLSGIGKPKFEVTANLTEGSIVIDDTDISRANWGIENLEIELNVGIQRNGSGIYSNLADHVGGLGQFNLRNIYVFDVGSSYAGIDLIDMRDIYAENIKVRTSAGGTAWRMATSGALNEGESLINKLKVYGLTQANAKAVHIIGGGGNCAANHTVFNQMQFGTQMVIGAGTVGVHIVNDWGITFNGLSMEGCQKQVWIDCNDAGWTGKDITFINPEFLITGTDADAICWDFDGGVRNVQVFGGKSIAAVNGKNVDCDSLGTWAETVPNKFWGHSFEVSGGGDPVLEVANNGTRFYEVGQENPATAYQEYQVQTGAAWVTPGGPTVWNGRRVGAYNSNRGEYREYVYLNGGWRFNALT